MNELIRRNNAQVTAISWQNQQTGCRPTSWQLEALLLNEALRRLQLGDKDILDYETSLHITRIMLHE
jgi:hypothetical protein